MLLPPIFWGLSFVAIKLGLASFSPFTLCALRFFLAGFPLILFFRFPPGALAKICAYSLSIGVLQYGLMFWAIEFKLPAGMSSVLIQSQVYVTIFLSYLIFKERVGWLQIVGFIISAFGLTIIGFEYFAGAHAVGFILILLSALFWSAGNVLLKTFRIADFGGFIAWTSFLSAIPLFALALIVDGPAAMVKQVANATWSSWAALAFMAVFATYLAFTLFSQMMLRWPAGRVMPFATLVPVYGLGSTALFLGEDFSPRQQLGAALVIAGLVVAVVIRSLRERLVRPRDSSSTGN